MDELVLTLDEWQTLMNAAVWHKQQAVETEKERISKILDWLETANERLSVDTIKLVAV